MVAVGTELAEHCVFILSLPMLEMSKTSSQKTIREELMW